MLTLLGILLALAYGLLMGGADAGEELMAMRGSAKIVRSEIVLETPAPQFGGVNAQQARNPAEIRFESGNEYVKWKNTLLRKPLMVAGGALDVETGEGYGTAQPFIRLPEERESFLALLGRELLPY
jgi:hypothetical protein